jgi:hypothetical protein
MEAKASAKYVITREFEAIVAAGVVELKMTIDKLEKPSHFSSLEWRLVQHRNIKSKIRTAMDLACEGIEREFAQGSLPAPVAVGDTQMLPIPLAELPIAQAVAFVPVVDAQVVVPVVDAQVVEAVAVTR